MKKFNFETNQEYDYDQNKFDNLNNYNSFEKGLTYIEYSGKSNREWIKLSTGKWKSI